ncbi:hypothetical protein BDZ97DRAFT_1926207 [Flammula alnicola]|nr:hypothetical protein BDZ97DRAFT_1926207 [Flammula alnicola]
MPSKIYKLFCLILPSQNPSMNSFTIVIDSGEYVADLRRVIKHEELNASTWCAHQLKLWKCALPADDNLQQTLNTLRFDGTDERLVLLDNPFFILSHHFGDEDLAGGVIHILVEVPGDYIRLQHADAHNEITEIAENIHCHERRHAPSTAAKSTEYVKIQAKQEFAIHDGLSAPSKSTTTVPLTTVAPPIHIFHPIFEQFSHDYSDPNLELSREFLLQVRDLMSFASQLQPSEVPSNATWRLLLSRLLGISVQDVENPDTTHTDGIALVNITDLGETVPFFFSELKNNLGEGGCDPSIQAGCSMRRAWVQSDRAQMRDKGCCPCLILAGGGPWMCILGAVFTDKVIVQRLTDMMWIGLSSTNEDSRIRRFASVMMALRRSLHDLQVYYNKIGTAQIPPFDRHSPHPRFYPYPTSFVENDEIIYFDYVMMLEDDPRCITYLAKIRGDVANIVVKFVDRYGLKVHRFLADKGYSPKLRYYGRLENGDYSPANDSSGDLSSGSMKMVVMDYVTPHCRRPANALDQLLRILTDLHVEGYVFGDLREPNVLFNQGGKVLLIDLDWAGRYDMNIVDTRLPLGLEKKIRDNTERIQGPNSTPTEFAHYPLNLSRNVSWPEGVAELLPIRPQHDWDMLNKLWAPNN